MERGLALFQWVIVVLGTLAATILNRTGSWDSRAEWLQYAALPTGFWLMIVPFVYAAICEVVRRRESVRGLQVLRAIGFVLLIGFILLFAWIIFDL